MKNLNTCKFYIKSLKLQIIDFDLYKIKQYTKRLIKIKQTVNEQDHTLSMSVSCNPTNIKNNLFHDQHHYCLCLLNSCVGVLVALSSPIKSSHHSVLFRSGFVVVPVCCNRYTDASYFVVLSRNAKLQIFVQISILHVQLGGRI